MPRRAARIAPISTKRRTLPAAQDRRYIDTGKVFMSSGVLPLGAGDGVAENRRAACRATNISPSWTGCFRNQREWNDEFGVTDVRGGLLKQTSASGMTEAQFDACLADTNATPSSTRWRRMASTARHQLHAFHRHQRRSSLSVAEYVALKVALDAALAGKIKPIAKDLQGPGWVSSDQARNLCCQKHGAIPAGESPVSRKTLFIVPSLGACRPDRRSGNRLFSDNERSQLETAAASEQGYEIPCPVIALLRDPKSKVIC